LRLHGKDCKKRRLYSLGGPLKIVSQMTLCEDEGVQRSRIQLEEEAPSALRTVAEKLWVPWQHTERQAERLQALGYATHPKLGVTPFQRETRSGRAKRAKNRCITRELPLALSLWRTSLSENKR